MGTLRSQGIGGWRSGIGLLILCVSVACVEPEVASGVNQTPGVEIPLPPHALDPIIAYHTEPPLIAGRCDASSWDLRSEVLACEGEPAPRCAGNTSPRLGQPQYLVDGRWQENLDARALSGHIVLLIPYEDRECNLGCGHFEERFNDPFGDGGDRGLLEADLPCGISTGGQCLTMWLYFDNALSGSYPFEFQVQDACGASSNLISGEIFF